LLLTEASVQADASSLTGGEKSMKRFSLLETALLFSIALIIQTSAFGASGDMPNLKCSAVDTNGYSSVVLYVDGADGLAKLVAHPENSGEKITREFDVRSFWEPGDNSDIDNSAHLFYDFYIPKTSEQVNRQIVKSNWYVTQSFTISSRMLDPKSTSNFGVGAACSELSREEIYKVFFSGKQSTTISCASKYQGKIKLTFTLSGHDGALKVFTPTGETEAKVWVEEENQSNLPEKYRTGYNAYLIDPSLKKPLGLILNFYAGSANGDDMDGQWHFGGWTAVLYSNAHEYMSCEINL